MSEMDVSTWKLFRVGDLFEIVRGKSKVMRNMSAGDMPLIAAARANQGIAGTYMIDAEYKDAITVSCNGVGCGSTFYHDGLFAITGDASVLIAKYDMSQHVKLFITAICDACFSYKYSYAEKCGPDILSNELISLPATPAGEPDWDYMENYMRGVMEREEVFAEHLASLTAEAVADGHEIDVSDWGEFRVGDLFEIRPTKSLGKTNQYLFDDKGTIPVVVNSAQNNGIGGYASYEPTENGGIVTFSDTTDANAIFYQHSPFIGYSHVQGMYPKNNEWTELSLLFFVAIFKSCALSVGFSYANKFRRDLAANLMISLPVTSTGEPDWAYMEQFMQQQMDKSQQLVEHLDRLI